MNAVAIEQLSREEKLSLMEALWNSLDAEEVSAVPPEWHRNVLESRLRRLADGSEPVSDWNEAKQRIQRLANAG